MLRTLRVWGLGGLLAASGWLAACGVGSRLGEGEPAEDASVAVNVVPASRDGGTDARVQSVPHDSPASSGSPSTMDAAQPARRPCGTGPDCDPTDLGGETCESLGYGGGRLLCDPTTCTFETGLCTGLVERRDGGLPCGTGGDCDPTDLGGASCESLGMGVGVLACDPRTCTFDTSLCAGGGTGSGGSGAGTGGAGG